jgi:hypothetical protein
MSATEFDRIISPIDSGELSGLQQEATESLRDFVNGNLFAAEGMQAIIDIAPDLAQDLGFETVSMITEAPIDIAHLALKSAVTTYHKKEAAKTIKSAEKIAEIKALEAAEAARQETLAREEMNIADKIAELLREQESKGYAYLEWTSAAGQEIIENNLPPAGQRKVNHILAAFKAGLTSDEWRLAKENYKYTEVPAIAKEVGVSTSPTIEDVLVVSPLLDIAAPEEVIAVEHESVEVKSLEDEVEERLSPEAKNKRSINVFLYARVRLIDNIVLQSGIDISKGKIKDNFKSVVDFMANDPVHRALLGDVEGIQSDAASLSVLGMFLDSKRRIGMLNHVNDEKILSSFLKDRQRCDDYKIWIDKYGVDEAALEQRREN